MRKDRILPLWDRHVYKNRVDWACTFFFFGKSICCILASRCIVVLVHMDEKLFYTVVMRSNYKVLTFIGLVSVDYYAHRKHCIGKEIYSVIPAFIFNDNDFTKGWKAIPITCVRVGLMVKAKIFI